MPEKFEFRPLRTREDGYVEDGRCIGCSRDLPNTVNTPPGRDNVLTGSHVPPSLLFLRDAPAGGMWDHYGLCLACLQELQLSLLDVVEYQIADLAAKRAARAS
jgi:hypothetical protein